MQELLSILSIYRVGLGRLAIVLALAAFVFVLLEENTPGRIATAIEATRNLNERETSARRAGEAGPIELARMRRSEFDSIASARRLRAKEACKRQQISASPPPQHGRWGEDPVAASCEELFEAYGSAESDADLVNKMTSAQADAISALARVIAATALAPFAAVVFFVLLFWLLGPFVRKS